MFSVLALYLTFFTEQGQYQPLPTEVQVPIIYAGVNGLVSFVLLCLKAISDAFRSLIPFPLTKSPDGKMNSVRT